MQLPLKVLMHERNTLRPVSNSFRAQLYLTKVSPKDLKYGSVETEWSMNIIKWPQFFDKTNRSRDILK